MKLYSDYLKRIKDVTERHFDYNLEKGFRSNYTFNESRDLSNSNLSKGKPNISPQDSLKPIATLLGLKEIKAPKNGDHPDFTHLRHTNSSEYHNIVSAFIDVKKSTNLFRTYTKEEIQYIIQTILLASTHTCALLGGHIQRMQFDGIFVYFGGRNIKKEDAIKQAITATSLFTYFVKYELKEVFQQNEIERIFTRTGIDFGDDSDVFWSVYGSGDCTELTTTSLHTSLAPKMQSNAESNGIVVGENIVNRLSVDSQYCEVLRNEDSSFNYIFTNPDYKQYKFNWSSYLCKTYSFFKKDENGKLYIDYEVGISNQNRLENLEKAIGILNTPTAYLHKNNEISTVPNQNPIPKNSFYYK